MVIDKYELKHNTALYEKILNMVEFGDLCVIKRHDDIVAKGMVKSCGLNITCQVTKNGTEMTADHYFDVLDLLNKKINRHFIGDNMSIEFASYHNL